MTSHTRGWRPDPFRVHEYRFFSSDGQPTRLVMDGGQTSHDRPPAVDQEPAREPPLLSSAPSIAEDRVSAAEVAVADTDDRGTGAEMPAPGVHSEAEPLGRGRKIAYGIVLVVLCTSLIGLLVVHIPGGGARSSGQAVTARTVTTTPRLATTTTTLAVPSALKADPDTAANALVSSWASGNRATALTVASASAVDMLFTVPYRAGLTEDRGCSTAFSPIVCTFGPPGGASPTDAIYQIDVSQAAGGWYASAVKIQN